MPVPNPDQFTYPRDLVLSLLPQAFDRNATPKHDEDEDHRQAGDPATGGNTMTHLADIRRVLDRMVYLGGLPDAIALYWLAHREPTERGEEALDLLLSALNGGTG